jgi:cytochrome c oxidase subunit 1
MISLTVFFFVGGAAAILFRLELMTPQGDLLISETYNRLFTLHGVVMVFFFLIPSIPAVLGNFLLPMMIGARDMAFPRLNLLSWYLFMAGGILAIAAIVGGGVDTGWTFYTPYSTTYANSQVMAMAIGIFVAGFSSILTGLNFIVTTHTMRAPGMTWFRLPLFVWSHYATAMIMVLGTPVLAISLALIALERGLGIGIFDPKLGGDPLLFQHLFWFYSHPAVYIMVLPSMAVVSEIIPCFARKRIFGYSFIAFSSVARSVGLRRNGVFLSQYDGGDPLRDQSVQLDRHPVQRFDLAGNSDAVRVGVHWFVYAGRLDWTFPGDAGNRCSRP